MKKLSILASFLLVLVAVGTATAAPKIAVVDAKKVIQDSKAGKAARAEYEADFTVKRNKIIEMQQEIKQLEEQLAKEQMKDIIERKKERLAKMAVDYRRLNAEYKEDMNLKEKMLFGKLAQQILEITQKVAKKKGYDLVLEKAPPVLFVDKSIDITGLVTKEFDKQYKDSKK